MKRLVLMMAVALMTTGCNGQQEEKIAEKGSDAITTKTDSLKNEPKISWDVKKEMDENGNIIRYDSTYTWSYTNMAGDSVEVAIDSIMRSFHSYFDQNYMPLWGKSFTEPLWQDSLFYRDFYRDDYFHNRWQQNFFEMDKMFRQMDSLRNQFFYDQYPGLLMPPPAQEKQNGKT